MEQLPSTIAPSNNVVNRICELQARHAWLFKPSYGSETQSAFPDENRRTSLTPAQLLPLIMSMITASVKRHEPLHPATEVSVLMRLQKQLEMVCDQTKPRQPHRHLFVSLPHQGHKRSGSRPSYERHRCGHCSGLEHGTQTHVVMLPMCVASPSSHQPKPPRKAKCPLAFTLYRFLLGAIPVDFIAKVEK